MRQRGSSDLLRVQTGESICLNCSMRNRYEVAEYHLRSGELDLLISAEKDRNRNSRTSGSVTGEKGGNITLTCEFEASEISDISLSSRSQDIPVRQEKNSSGRIFKKGDCDIVIKDLVFRDAGTYILRVYYHNDQPKNRTYHLHIHDEITVKKGKPLKLDVLLSNADKVETNSSGVWKEIWNRISRVQDDHLSDSDGNLTIKEFMKHDEGTYRVLDYEGKTLITVTIIGVRNSVDV
ncbi:hypothetical protein G5714_019099 [Onychostoma macrolepis]|uniref:Immunoglobulin domain-containing protein n=1 Tax=Onychostoma macrolepis TaxID=369639 RepID=A0A7J6C2C6_9TELE|nr:hypothetical protein G5714_019099 [Onychostoma macrolepis]